MSASGKSGAAEDYMELYLPNSVAARERLKTLVSEVVAAKQNYEEVVKSDHDTVKMGLDLPRYIHSGLKALAMGCKHAKSGRSVGLYAYAIKVLEDHVLNKGFSASPAKENQQAAPQTMSFSSFGKDP
jgi:hypothetical protein